MESKLKLFSLGIVIEDKPSGDIVIVSPIEHINLQDNGLLKDNSNSYKNDLPDINGKVLSSEVKSSNYLRAKWIPFSNSNRMTAPDVIKGETIILFKFSDVDEYYWTTLFREPELRRLEDVVYAFSNLRKGIEAFDKETSYWFNVSTKNKKIHLHTSKNDSELTTYDLTIDTKNGNITIEDGKGNKLTLNSKNDSYNIETNTSVNIKAGKVVNIKAPNIILDGNVNITGNLSSNGSSLTRGNSTTQGNIDTQGNIRATGRVDASNVS